MVIIFFLLQVDMPALQKWWCVMLMENSDLWKVRAQKCLHLIDLEMLTLYFFFSFTLFIYFIDRHFKSHPAR